MPVDLSFLLPIFIELIQVKSHFEKLTYLAFVVKKSCWRLKSTWGKTFWLWNSQKGLNFHSWHQKKGMDLSFGGHFPYGIRISNSRVWKVAWESYKKRSLKHVFDVPASQTTKAKTSLHFGQKFSLFARQLSPKSLP